MKLTKRLPTKPGLYWCWSEGMAMPAGHRLTFRVFNVKVGQELFIETGGGCLSPFSIFTHFAGPIPFPDLPEPDKIELTGRLYWPPEESPSLLFLPYTDVPDSFVMRKLKVTLEKA